MRCRSCSSINALAAFSLSGLLLSRVWSKLQSPWGWGDSATKADYAAALTNLGLGTAVMIGLYLLARQTKKRFALDVVKLAFVVMTFIGVWSLASAIWPGVMSSDPLRPGAGRLAVRIGAALFIAMLAFFAVRRDMMVRISRTLLVLFLPVSLVAALQSGQGLLSSHPSASFHLGKVATTPARHRVVVLLFDEMDELTAFVQRPTDVKMPEFDRFRSESFAGENAFPPGFHTTISIPSFLTGKLMADAELMQSGELMLKEYGTGRTGRSTGWENIFSELRSMGLRSAVISDALPYSHMMKPLPDYLLDGEISAPFDVSLLRQWQTFAAAERLHLAAVLKTDRERHLHISEFRRTVTSTQALLDDDRYDFTFVHLCMPHDPFIYDRFKNEYSDDASRTYSDNLALSDRVLGELRRSMEKSGEWDSSSVIILSDHWWRVRPTNRAEHRSVFMVKLPHEKVGISYEKPFNTIVFHDLVLQLLQGRIGSPVALQGWIGAHSPYGESPVTKSCR